MYEGVFNNLRVCVKRVRVLSKDGPQEVGVAHLIFSRSHF